MLVLPPIEEPAEYNLNAVYWWNHAALQLHRISHSTTGGPQSGPTMSSRALGLLHLAMHDAYFLVAGGPSPYLPPGTAGAVPPGASPDEAMTGAAITVLRRLYGPAATRMSSRDVQAAIAAQLDESIGHWGSAGYGSPAFVFGASVARLILDRLAVRANEPGADGDGYMPNPTDRYKFREDPSHPVRLVPLDPNVPDGPQRAVRLYHGPFYGTTARIFATHGNYNLEAPPAGGIGYVQSLQEVVALGGAEGLDGTIRSADQTVTALFWAYDGANLLGAPPRLYNQILRKVAWERRTDTATPGAPLDTPEFVRLFALANAAMADAAVFAWREKFCHEFWRPLSGVREHDVGAGPGAATGTNRADPDADPFWRTLGAPETNTNRLSFKPPFPAYPSGHATFGAALFQTMRLFYKQRNNLPFATDEPDAIAFDFVSEELNGVSRDLYQEHDPSAPITEQPGLVRTRVVRRFKSLWEAMFDNAISRIYLGVHWNFDAFDPSEVKASPAIGDYKDSDDIRYVLPPPDGTVQGVGGVPLGISIANDIFRNGLSPRQGSETLSPVCPAVPTVPPAPAPVPAAAAASASAPSGGVGTREVEVKSTNTNIR